MAYAALIGAEVKRKEDPRLIRGAGTYVGDLKPAGMAHVALVRSPHAHASFSTIDGSAAMAMPGVLAVISGQELLDACRPLPLAGSGEGGAGERNFAGRTRFVLAVERVRHVGEAVAAVVAETFEAAIDGALAVEVDWQPLEAVADMQAAAADGAPLLFNGVARNIDHTRRRQAGDVEAAFAAAQHIVRRRISNQRLLGFPMEGRAVLAVPDAANEQVTVWTSTQTPHQVRGEIAKVLGLDENTVRVIAPDVGGGFGVKIGLYPEEALVPLLARRMGRPLRWIEGRLEHVQATTHGRGQICDAEAAVAADGRILGLRMRILADLGAWPLAPGLPDLTTAMATGVYHIPNVDLEATTVYTNTTPVAAYRGAGRPEAAYYIERLIDLIAQELGRDPSEVRRINFIPPDAFPYRTPTGLTYDSGEYARALDTALQLSRYEQLRAEQARRRAAGERIQLGIGTACYVEMCGFGPYESAQIKVEPSGTVTVSTGASPHGQGLYTTFAQIVHDRIGAEFDQIVVRSGDTATTPMGVGTMGSRSLAVGGAALARAAERVRAKAQQIAASLLEARPDDIELSGGRYIVRGVPDRGVTLREIARRAYSSKLPAEIDPGLEATDYFKPPELIYPFGAHVAAVEVDTETGVVRIREYYSVDDCGPRISPMIVAGQVHGGLAQGIAQALFEEVVYNDSGQPVSGTLMDYALPRAADFPPFTLGQTETPTPLNPLGVKGIGEAATIGSTPAIVNAVIDALAHRGVQHIDMPLRAEKIWRALQGDAA